MTTAADLITTGILYAGIGDQYNPLDGNTSSLALTVLNSMIDSWSTEQLTVYNITEGTFPLVAGTSLYQLGPAASLGARPAFVRDISIVDSSSVTYPMRIIGVDEWSQIVYKPAPGRPEVAYFDGGVPTVGCYLYPTPAFSSDVAHVWYGGAITQFTGLTNVVTAPPGFVLAFELQFAMKWCLINKQPIAPDLRAQAIKAKNVARSTNNQPTVLDLDLPIPGTRWSIYIGGYL